METDPAVSLWCEEVESPQSQDEKKEDNNESRAAVLVQIGGPFQVRGAWDPSVSGHRVIQRLLTLEQRYMPSVLYVTLIQSDPERREELVKWAMEVRD